MLLSGGVDSSAILALLSEKLSSHPLSFSIGFREHSYNEIKYARQVAKHCKVNLHERLVESHMAYDLPKVVWHSEDALADPSAIPMYYLAEMVSQHVKVAIGGDGADELFAGYETYQADYLARVNAVAKFKTLDEAEALAAANKRVANILAKQEVDESVADVDSRLLQEEAEIALHSALMEAKEKVAGAIEAQDYPVILSTLATLRNTIDSFFDNVMVMAEDEAIKLNRLALLSLLRQLFLTTADISLLAKS